MTKLFPLKIIDVILPVPLRGVFSYGVPEAMEYPQRGLRVLVPWGKQEVVGLVYGPHEGTLDEGIVLREIIMVLDTTPAVTSEQMRLWQWIAEY
ncbi:MAG: primosomal protein N', partial [Paludibacteraceae bacterium]|nr:primosomal protein N' [Paludibacteraceae bacterium]